MSRDNADGQNSQNATSTMCTGAMDRAKHLSAQLLMTKLPAVPWLRNHTVEAIFCACLLWKKSVETVLNIKTLEKKKGQAHVLEAGSRGWALFKMTSRYLQEDVGDGRQLCSIAFGEWRGNVHKRTCPGCLLFVYFLHASQEDCFVSSQPYLSCVSSYAQRPSQILGRNFLLTAKSHLPLTLEH